MLLISKGRVKRTMPETTPPHKIGYIIDNENFEFAAGMELQPGDYDMQITVSDMVGNVYNENKRFTVKR